MGKATRNIGKHNWGGKKTKKSKYMTRNEAVRYLQLSLGDFRRLCILKGIHPKQPTKSQLSNKSKLTIGKPLKKGVLYYYVKDIKFMNHDPLIVKFREHKIFLRRLSKANSKLDFSHAKALESNAKPHFTYDHLVKERYPTFQSALYDLDDCLTLMFMFHHLPSGYGGIEPQRLSLVKKLCDEFCSHVVSTRSLKKCFVSFKGIYYQAQLYGQKITWVVPHGFTQQIPQEADFKVFKTFLTFYTTLMTFVNFKLYHDREEEYPPVCPHWRHSLASYLLDTNQMMAAAATAAIGTIGGTATTTDATTDDGGAMQQELNELIAKSNNQMYANDSATSRGDDDDDESHAMLLNEEMEESRANKTVDQLFEEKFLNLYKNMTFYLSRETPIASLEFVIRSFGGRVITDALLNHQSNHAVKTTITHYVIDRPVIPSVDDLKTSGFLSPKSTSADAIEFIQPQWVYDCVNAKVLIPAEKYQPGQKLPPHLSPFEQDMYGQQQQGQQQQQQDGNAAPTFVYEPKYAQELRNILEQEMDALRRIKRRQGASAASVDYDDEDGDEEEGRGLLATLARGLPRATGDNQEETVSDDEELEDVHVTAADTDSEAEEEEEQRYTRELEMEKTGMKYSDFSKQLEKEGREKQIKSIRATGAQVKSKDQLKHEQELELRKSMMSRRKAKLYEQEMKKLNKQKKRVNELMKKRLELEEQEEEQREKGSSAAPSSEPRTIVTAEDDSDNENDAQEKPTKSFDMDKDELDDYDLSHFEPIDDDEEEDLLGDVELPDEEAESSDDEEPAPVVSAKKTNNKKQPIQQKKNNSDKKRKEAPTSTKNNTSNKKNKKQRTK